MIGGAAVVIHDEARVRHGNSVANQCARAIRAEGFCYSDEVVDRHDASLDCRRDSPQIAVARQYHLVRPHLRIARSHQPIGPGTRHAERGGSLVQPRAVALRGAREPQGIIHRMQMSASRIERTAVVGVRGHHRAHLGAVDNANLRITVTLAQMIDMTARVLAKGLFVIGVQQSRAKIAAYAVGFNQRVEISPGILREIPEPAGIRLAHVLFDPFLIAAQPDVSLAAVAPRCPPGEPGLLEQYDFDAAFREMQRCRQTGEAAADDTNLGAAITLDPRGRHLLRNGRRVVGGRVLETRSERILPTVRCSHL